MRFKKKAELLKSFGLRQDEAEYYAEQDGDKVRAVLPVFRLLHPLNEQLKFYRDDYASKISEQKDRGSIQPQVKALLDSGASPEQIAEFAYQTTLMAYENLLYFLDDTGAADLGGEMLHKLERVSEKCGGWRLVEISPDGELTGRCLSEVHGKLPFDN